MSKIKMVVLTKSSKYRNYCVAGINLENGKFLRLVTNDSSIHGAVKESELTCSDGNIIDVLDVIEVSVNEHSGKNEIQPENVLLNSNESPKIIQKMSIDDVLENYGLDDNNTIFGNNCYYVLPNHVSKLGHSLTLVKVEKLEVYLIKNIDGVIKTKANFWYKGSYYYELSVTDRNYFNINDKVCYENAVLVVSIGEPFNEKHYKFVSAIYII